MSTTRVLLADLSHVKTGDEWSVLPMPVNMGYLAAFATAYASNDTQVRICKSPADLIRLMDEFEPHVVAFSNYIWNANLAATAADWVRRTRPETLIVMGGPNINTTELDVAARFLSRRPAVDYYVPNEGEVPFLRILQAFAATGHDRAALIGTGIRGTWSLADGVIRPDDVDVEMPTIPGGLDVRTGRLLDLDDIPSPYLSGVMDEYLAHPGYVPLIETNRGCPYSCTFCSWGDMAKSKSASFPVERILKELDFLADANVSRVSYLYIGDANFGLFQRDVEIAHRLRELKDTKGFPEHVYLYFAKNSSTRVVEIAGILQGMTPISLSRQTQNADVLKNIKRSNIDIDTFNSLSRHAKALGVDSFAELIYGLPEESLDSFMSGVQEVLDSDVDGLHFFPAMLLEGSEMATENSREVYGLRGEYRAIDSASGDYGPFAATEFEEIVTSSAVYSREDYFTVRRLHFIQSLLLDVHAGGRIFYGLRALTQGRSMYALMESIAREPETGGPAAAFWAMLDAFQADASAEFVTADELDARRTSYRPDARVMKLNPAYLTRLLYAPGNLPAFLDLLSRRITELYGTDRRLVDAVLDVIHQRIYPFDGSTQAIARVHIDLQDLARAALAPREVPLVADQVLETPLDVQLWKGRTYAEQLEPTLARMPRHEAIYDLALHHSRENIGRLLTWSLAPGEATGGRTITNEGGWLY